MNWQCRLYGHQWRHPGAHEVVLVEERVPAYPYECAVCEATMVLDRDGTQQHEWTVTPASEPELEAESDTEFADESALEPREEAGQKR